MALIGFSDESVWIAAGWVFERFIRDVRRACPADDHALASVLQQSEALDGLQIDTLDAKLQGPATRLLREVAMRSAEGGESDADWESGLDREGKEMYRRAMARLVDLIDTLAR